MYAIDEVKLRDWFAGQYIANNGMVGGPSQAAKSAYEIADAMMKARTVRNWQKLSHDERVDLMMRYGVKIDPTNEAFADALQRALIRKNGGSL